MDASQAIDFDDSFSDTELLPVALPLPPAIPLQPATQPRIAIALTMVAQQTLLPVASAGRRRSRSPTAVLERRPNHRRAIPRADPGPTVER